MQLVRPRAGERAVGVMFSVRERVIVVQDMNRLVPLYDSAKRKRGQFNEYISSQDMLTPIIQIFPILAHK